MLYTITESFQTSHGINIKQVTVIDVTANVKMIGVKSDVAFAEHQTIDNKALLNPANLTQVSKFHLSGSPEKGTHEGRGNILKTVAVYQNDRLVFGEPTDYSSLNEYVCSVPHQDEQSGSKGYVPLKSGNALKTTKKAKSNPGSESTTTTIRKVKYKIKWQTRYFNPALGLTVSRYLRGIGGHFELKQDELGAASIFLVQGDKHTKLAWLVINDAGYCVIKQTQAGYNDPKLLETASLWFNTLPVSYLDAAVVHEDYYREFKSTKTFIGYAYSKDALATAKKIRKPGKKERLAAKAAKVATFDLSR